MIYIKEHRTGKKLSRYRLYDIIVIQGPRYLQIKPAVSTHGIAYRKVEFVSKDKVQKMLANGKAIFR